MGTATAVGETLRARHEKHFISLWGQQLVALCMSTNRPRNISYPYGDSNHRLSSRTHGSGKHFIPLWGQQQFSTLRFAAHGVKHFIPLWGQQPAKIEIALSTLMKHFIPLWGQQQLKLGERMVFCGNISYPYGDSNLWYSVVSFPQIHGNISYPYGDSNFLVLSCVLTHAAKHFVPLWGQQPIATNSAAATFSKHFIPLWGQQLSVLRLDSVISKYFIPLWGQQLPYQSSLVPGTPETFHTPSGTKRKPICPIGHIGFYFIRYCYSHVTPPIPSAVLMPTPAYGAKCSSRFAIVR